MKVVVDFEYVTDKLHNAREVIRNAEIHLGVKSLKDLGVFAVEHLTAITGIEKYRLVNVKLCDEDGNILSTYSDSEAYCSRVIQNDETESDEREYHSLRTDSRNYVPPPISKLSRK